MRSILKTTLQSEHSPAPSWMLTAISLLFLTVVTQLANQFYLSFNQGQPFSEVIIPSLIFLSVLTVPALWIGITLGGPLGLGIFNLPPLPRRDRHVGVVFAIFGGLLLGATLLVLRWVLLPYLPAELPDYGFRGAIGGLLVSLGAAVGEEVWFRFGLMTLLLFICAKLRQAKPLSDNIALGVILFVSFAFGLAHLPQLLSYEAGTPFAIYATVLGNIAVGSLYGWCYWRFGLFSAITAHFSVDIVLHVLPALL